MSVKNKIKFIGVFFVAIFMFNNLFAQIEHEKTLEGQFFGYSDGKIFIADRVNGKVNIYNDNYSLYKSVSINNISYYESIIYPSRYLFNNDEKFEFVIACLGTNSTTFKVYNEDGDLLENISFNGSAYWQIVNSNKLIFYILQYDSSNNMSYQTEIYSLPGTYSYEDDVFVSKQLMCYPNPAKNVIAIPYILNPGEFSSLKVFDVNGRMVEELQLGSDFNEILLDISKYAPGVYFYSINGNSNKFIVE